MSVTAAVAATASAISVIAACNVDVDSASVKPVIAEFVIAVAANAASAANAILVAVATLSKALARRTAPKLLEDPPADLASRAAGLVFCKL